MLGWLRNLFLLTGLATFAPAAFFALRLYIGAYLIWGVSGSIVHAARMEEFEGFLRVIGSPWPDLAAPLSVWTQFLIGWLLIPGLFTRWAGILLAINFLLAMGLIATSQWGYPRLDRELFGPAVCTLVGLVLATHGAGRWSLDAVLEQARLRPSR